MKKRMLDLFCGRFGWGRAFAARGWEVVGVDLVDPPEIPQGCTFVKRDVLTLDVDFVGQFDFVCASSPCEEFSTIRNFQKPRPAPDMGILLFNHTRRICEQSGVPYVMENVSGAPRYIGEAAHRCGPFYLWGTGVPPMMPQGISKGLTMLAMGLREKKGMPGWDNRHGSIGRTPAALVATIPPELASCVADYAERLLEQEASVGMAASVPHP